MHVRGLDIVGIEQKTARPDNRGRAVAEAAKFLAFKLYRMAQAPFAVINIALARPSLKEHRNGEEMLAFFDCP